MKLKIQYKIICEIILFALLVFLDQITKYLVVLKLKPVGYIPLIDGVLEFRYLENSGAAFGLFQNKILFFSIIAIIIFIVILYAKIKINKTLYGSSINTGLKKKYLWLDVIFLILISGALGNLIDRIHYNYVVDFIYFKLINFPIFNVADCYVTISAVSLIIMFIFVLKEQDYIYLFPEKKGKDSFHG